MRRTMATIDDLAERVERLLLRHDELKRTNALLEQQLDAVSTERDSLKVAPRSRARAHRRAARAAARRRQRIAWTAMKQIEVTIMGQSYVLGCPEGGEQSLLEAVGNVDREMSAIRDAGKVKARERIAVLAALNLAYSLAERPLARGRAARPRDRRADASVRCSRCKTRRSVARRRSPAVISRR